MYVGVLNVNYIFVFKQHKFVAHEIRVTCIIKCSTALLHQ
jgi:hypothetical protein